jgi:hypothetical protein
MMISELCTNGDLFDYIRNEKAPTLSRVVSLLSPTPNVTLIMVISSV